MPNQTILAEKTSSPDQPDSELVAKLISGDERSFEHLIRTHGGYLMSVARRYLSNDADVQDCVQETFLKAFEKVHTFENRSSLRSWLHRIAVNQALSKLRTYSRRPEQLLEDTSALFDEHGKRILMPSETTGSAESAVSSRQDLEDVRNVIAQLPDTSRNLLLLRDVEGYSTEETAKLLGTSISSVKTGLHRARHALKMRIEV